MRTQYTEPLTEDQKKLVVDNLGLVHFTVSRFYKPYMFDDDIISLGYIGLMKAAQSWNVERGAFAAYAVWKIRSDIHHFFHVSCALKRNDFENRLPNNMLRRVSKERGEFEVDVFKTIESSENMEENALNQIVIKKALKTLEPVELEVVRLRYIEKERMRAIAEKQKVTMQCVRQRKNRALRKMKAFLQEV